MRHKPKNYRARVYQTTFLAGVGIFVAILVLLTYFFTVNQRVNYLQVVTSSSSNATTSGAIAMSIINNTITESLNDPSLTNLATSKSRNEFLFNAIAVKNHLMKSNTNMAGIDYTLNITLLTPLEMDGERFNYFISGKNAEQADTFLQGETGLGPEAVDRIQTHFKLTDSALIIPAYDENRLIKFHIFVKRTISNTDFLVLVTVPFEVLIPPTSSEAVLVYYRGKQLIAHYGPQPESLDATHLFPRIRDLRPQSLYVGKYPVTINQIPNSDIYVAHIYRPPSFSTDFILTLSVILLTTLGILYLVFSKISDFLYRPIKDILLDSITPGQYSKQIDELAVFRANNAMLKKLTDSMQKVTRQNALLKSQASFHNLLFSKNIDPKNYTSLIGKDGPFCLAVFEFQLERKEIFLINQIAVQKSLLQEYAIENGLYYVTINSQRCAFILRSDSVEQVKQEIYRSLSSLEETDMPPCFIAISDFCPTITGLQHCYQQTHRILEYRNYFTNSNIVSYAQIEYNEANIYSYSLAVENKLIRNVIAGSEKALEIYDQIIEDNFVQKRLSLPSSQSLTFSLLGTILRIFQELKTDPLALLGRQIDYKELYDRWADAETRVQIRAILEETITAMQKRRSSSDQDLLSGMKQYIYEHYWDNIMLQDLAYHFNISPQYCGILFKELSDNNFKDFLNRYRINKAKEILETKPGIKVNELYSLVGFTNANSFIRVFRKYAGVTPGAYSTLVAEDRMGASYPGNTTERSH